MKKLHSKNTTKKIIFVIAILMLCNFVMPNLAYAETDLDNGGPFMDYVAKFLCFLPDATLNILQHMFTSPTDIDEKNEYKIYYSPGIIFSGEVPALKTNFLTANDQEKEKPYSDIKKEIYDNVAFYTNIDIDAKAFYEAVETNTEIITPYYENYGYNDDGTTKLPESFSQEPSTKINGKQYNNFNIIIPWETADNRKYSLIVDGIAPEKYTEYDGSEYAVYQIKVTMVDGIAKKEYVSSAVVLKPIIASWYRAFRRIAIVGLLSVLVYIGIRIILKSTSADGKAKYKKMLKDWFVALCLLFLLHCIMNIVVIVVDEIGSVLSQSVAGAEGEDVLLTTLRNKIADGSSWGVVITKVVLYDVIAVFTIMFTVQYIKRLVYLAFLTMIAPLVTLTYPLDKIKDSKAQAFDMWIKDYVFFNLLQIIHLLVYYMLVSSSMDMADEGNWIFAIIIIGFLTKAEALMKKMFGFEKSKSMGAVTAAATGALIMNSITKVKEFAQKGAKGGSSGSNSNSRQVRTQNGNSSESKQNTSAAEGSQARRTEASNQEIDGQQLFGSNGNYNNNSQNTRPNKNVLNGVKAVGKKYKGPAAKALKGALRTAGGVALGAAGGTMGFAMGVAQGDVQKAITGAAGGAAAGYYTGQKTVNKAEQVVDGTVNAVPKTIRTAKDIAKTFKEGADE